MTEKLDKGLLDFAVVCSTPDSTKYRFIEFPEADRFGLVVPRGHPLAARDRITAADLTGLPLFCSEQSWENDIRPWAGERFDQLRLEGSFRLAYNGSMFALEALGCLLTLEHLIDVSPASGLRFIPLAPRLELRFYLIWNRYQTFTPIAERFLSQVFRSGLRLQGGADDIQRVSGRQSQAEEYQENGKRDHDHRDQQYDSEIKRSAEIPAQQKDFQCGQKHGKHCEQDPRDPFQTANSFRFRSGRGAAEMYADVGEKGVLLQ